MPTIEELATENTALKQDIVDLKAAVEDLKKAQEEQSKPEKDVHGCIIGKEQWDETEQKCVPIPAKSEPSPEVARLNKEIADIKKERHAACLKATVDARFEAGLAPTKEDETTRLANFSDEYLKILEADANSVSARIKSAAKASGPITKYDEDKGDTLEAAKDTMREKLNLKPIKKEAA